MGLSLPAPYKTRLLQCAYVVVHAFVGAGIALWWVSLRETDQPVWAGAIGSLVAGIGAFAAAVAAVWIAGVERRIRQKDRHENALVAASFIYSDISKLAAFGCELHRSAISIATVEPNKPYANNVLSIKQTVGPMRQMSERTSLDRINALPADVAINLARAVGGLPFPCDMIESTIDALNLMAIRQEDAKSQLSTHAAGLRVPLRRLVSFFEWYGKALPENSMATASVIAFIHSEVGKPLMDDDVSDGVAKN